MSDAMTKTSAALQSIAAKLDDVLFQVAGQPMAFSLMVWPMATTTKRANYIANCPRDEVVKCLEELLARWKEGGPDVPVHELH